MERIEFAIDLVHYEPPRSGQPLNSLDCSDPIEPLSIIVLLMNP